jgi:hypothetical protein
MTTKPTTYPEWCTNPDNNPNPDIVVPSGPKIQEGWNPEEFPPSQFLNWQQNLNGEWIKYFDEFTRTEKGIQVRSNHPIQFTNAGNLVFTADIEFIFRDGATTRKNIIQSSASPIAIADGSVLVFRPSLAAASVNLVAGTYATLAAGEYDIVTEASLTNANSSDEVVLFRRRDVSAGNDAYGAGFVCLEIVPTGQQVIGDANTGARFYLGGAKILDSVRVLDGDNLTVFKDNGSTATFFVNGTSGLVGIGTASPASPNSRSIFLDINANFVSTTALPGMVLTAGSDRTTGNKWEMYLGGFSGTEANFILSSGTRTILSARDGFLIGAFTTSPVSPNSRAVVFDVSAAAVSAGGLPGIAMHGGSGFTTGGAWEMALGGFSGTEASWFLSAGTTNILFSRQSRVFSFYGSNPSSPTSRSVAVEVDASAVGAGALAGFSLKGGTNFTTARTWEFGQGGFSGTETALFISADTTSVMGMRANGNIGIIRNAIFALDGVALTAPLDYILSDVSDSVKIFTSGSSRLHVNSTRVAFTNHVYLSSGNRLYYDGGSNTFSSYNSGIQTLSWTINGNQCFGVNNNISTSPFANVLSPGGIDVRLYASDTATAGRVGTFSAHNFNVVAGSTTLLVFEGTVGAGGERRIVVQSGADLIVEADNIPNENGHVTAKSLMKAGISINNNGNGINSATAYDSYNMASLAGPDAGDLYLLTFDRDFADVNYMMAASARFINNAAASNEVMVGWNTKSTGSITVECSDDTGNQNPIFDIDCIFFGVLV